ncbi:MAG: hypothetical protein ACTSV0_08785, partial [Candidatus Freyarchaeota archaeon]
AFVTLTTPQPPLIAQNTQKSYAGQTVKNTYDPTIILNGFNYTCTNFSTSETAWRVIEDNDNGVPAYCNVTWTPSDSNRSIAMSFNTSNVETFFNGVELYIKRVDGTSIPDLTVELWEGVKYGTNWVPGSMSITHSYSCGSFSTSGGWVRLLNENPHQELKESHVYFIVLRLSNPTDGGNYYNWRYTNDTGGNTDGVDEGFASFCLFNTPDDLDDESKWSLEPYDFWMKVNLTTYKKTEELQFPAGWDLNNLKLAVSAGIDLDDSVNGSVTGQIANSSSALYLNMSDLTGESDPGDLIYMFLINFTGWKPVSYWYVVESSWNTAGWAHTAGHMMEAQRFTLTNTSENLTIGIVIRNNGMNVDLVAEIRNAIQDDQERYYPSSTIASSITIPHSSVSSSFSELLLNFTGTFTSGEYFLVLHTAGWEGKTNGTSFYDWASYTDPDSPPPDAGFELWTVDNGTSWNQDDVRDPYGNRYWHYLRFQTSYPPSIRDLDLKVEGKPVGDDGVWNSTVWKLIPPNQGNVSFNVTTKSGTSIRYNANFTVWYLNFTSNTTWEVYVNDQKAKPKPQGFYYMEYTDPAQDLGYNKSQGNITLVFKVNTTSGWADENITLFYLATLQKTYNESMTSEVVLETNYTHSSDVSVTLDQTSMYIDYGNSSLMVETVYINETRAQGNWVDTEQTEGRGLIVLKNAFKSLVGTDLTEKETMNCTVYFLTTVNVALTSLVCLGDSQGTLNITNVTDAPSVLNVILIYPNGTTTLITGQNTTLENKTWNASFTPPSTGRYFAIIRTNSSRGVAATRVMNSTRQSFYAFTVYQLGVGLVESAPGGQLVVGVPSNLQIWVRYLPYDASETPQVNVTSLKVYLNGTETGTPNYNSTTGLWKLQITPSRVGTLRITLSVTDDANRTRTENFTIRVVPPTPQSPIPILSALTVNAAISVFNMNTIARITGAALWLLILALLVARAFYPDTLDKIHRTLLRAFRKP